ncbi:MAG: hypothetical protein AB1426_01240 [Bacillota bacterium]
MLNRKLLAVVVLAVILAVGMAVPAFAGQGLLGLNVGQALPLGITQSSGLNVMGLPYLPEQLVGTVDGLVGQLLPLDSLLPELPVLPIVAQLPLVPELVDTVLGVALTELPLLGTDVLHLPLGLEPPWGGTHAVPLGIDLPALLGLY